MVDVPDVVAAPAAEPEPAPKPRRQPLARVLADWERTVAVAIGIVTLTAALLTYFAVRQDDAAAEARGQATLETLQLERQQMVAAIRVDAETAAANRYRTALAEAEATEAQATAAQTAGDTARAAQLWAEALVQRSVAASLQVTTFDLTRMTGATSAGTYDSEHRLETIQGYEAYEAIHQDQPTNTAKVADARHAQSIRTMLAVVVLLVLVLLLTVGRVLRPSWRIAILTTAAAGFVAATIGAIVNAAVGA